jgi:membrane-associated phospholipid phosphatase
MNEMSLRPSEWVVVVYFLYLFVAAVFSKVPSGRRVRVGSVAFFVIVAVLGFSRADRSWFRQMRDWMPIVYLLAAYRTPALLVSAPSVGMEWELAAFDARWFGGKEIGVAERTPRWCLEVLELAYLLCYPLIPAGWICLRVLSGARQQDQYWTAVMLAAACCYGLLPWLPTRSPRTTDAVQSPRSTFRRLNLRVLDRMSVQLNTFPSGHVATSFAAALAAAAAVPLAGVLLGFTAFAIMLASVVGRYHYVADVLAGAAVSVVAFALSRLL